FASAGFNFVGNVEGNDLLTGKADVVVCEGFVGNVVLKVFEGIGHYFHDAVAASLRDASAAQSPLGQSVLALTKKLDYAEYAGARRERARDDHARPLRPSRDGQRAQGERAVREDRREPADPRRARALGEQRRREAGRRGGSDGVSALRRVGIRGTGSCLPEKV